MVAQRDPMTNETDTELEKRANEYARKLGDECLCARTNPLTPAGECISIFCGCHVAESYVSGALSERQLHKGDKVSQYMAEAIALEQEVASLRAEVRRLRSFLNIHDPSIIVL